MSAPETAPRYYSLSVHGEPPEGVEVLWWHKGTSWSEARFDLDTHWMLAPVPAEEPVPAEAPEGEAEEGPWSLLWRRVEGGYGVHRRELRRLVSGANDAHRLRGELEKAQAEVGRLRALEDYERLAGTRAERLEELGALLGCAWDNLPDAVRSLVARAEKAEELSEIRMQIIDEAIVAQGSRSVLPGELPAAVSALRDRAENEAESAKLRLGWLHEAGKILGCAPIGVPREALILRQRAERAAEAEEERDELRERVERVTERHARDLQELASVAGILLSPEPVFPQVLSWIERRSRSALVADLSKELGCGASYLKIMTAVRSLVRRLSLPLRLVDLRSPPMTHSKDTAARAIGEERNAYEDRIASLERELEDFRVAASNVIFDHDAGGPCTPATCAPVCAFRDLRSLLPGFEEYRDTWNSEDADMDQRPRPSTALAPHSVEEDPDE